MNEAKKNITGHGCNLNKTAYFFQPPPRMGVEFLKVANHNAQP
jgi:hypothetical protein